MSGPGNAAAEPLSADDFYALPEEEGYRLELVRGRVVREPLPGPQHGRLDVRLAARLFDHVEQASLGVVLSNTGFVLATDPDTVRGPDLCFVAAARIPTEPYAGGYGRLAPDLVVEILSRSNRRGWRTRR
jgi:Uma2 family endonuclease